MAVDCFLKLDDIKGESADAKHGNEIDVLSWQWGASQTASFQTGTGGGTAKVNVNDITITKRVDRASPTLLGMCFSGTPIKLATLTMRKAGPQPVEYLQIIMEDAIISSTNHSSKPTDEQHTETVTLNFARVKFHYTPQKADGSPDASVKFGFDIRQNTKYG